MDIEHILRNPAGIEAEGHEVAFSKCIRLLKSLAAGLLSPFKINVVERIDGRTSTGVRSRMAKTCHADGLFETQCRHLC